MKKALLVLLSVACFASMPAHSQVGHMALSNSPAYEAAAAPLRSAPPRQYNFSRAVLSDVMRLMAEDAGIGFFGLPEGSGNGENLVTFTLNSSPFVALETLAKANGVALIHDSGIWYLRSANDQELIGRIYEINYNAQELVKKNNQSTGGQDSSSGGSGPSSGLNLQGAPDFFVTEPSRILEDIQNILDLSTTGGSASFAPTASVDNVAHFSMGDLQGRPDLVARMPVVAGRDGTSPANQSKVIWNSDSNTLYVVASRQQHQWVEAYLASADRPQPMIAVEVKFIETSRDPSSELGIDWNGVLRSGDTSLSFNNPLSTLGAVGGGYTLPTAVLSFSDLNAQLRAIYNDRKTRMVSYPRMVTLDNREVSFRSVVNQPVLASSSSASLGAGATETASVEYLPIGTVINILPKRMAGNKILLNVSVTVSDIIGTEIIKGNPYPIATSRVYTAPLTVQSGYTVAISGLDAASANETETGIPILGRLPVIGNAFKNRKQDKSRQHLMMLITPVSLNTGTEGLTEKPITREPWKAAPAHSYPVTSAKAPVYGNDGRGLRARPVDDVPDFDHAASDRKANRTFGRIQGEIVEPSYAGVAERSPAAKVEPEMVKPDPLAASLNASTLAPKAHPANTPMVVTTGDIGNTAEPVTAATAKAAAKPEKKAPAAAPAKADEPKAVAEAAPAEAPEDPRLAEIRKKIGNLQADLAKIPEGDGKLSPDDGQLVLNVHEGAQKLLGEVEKVRSDKNQPLGGSLGDTWWDLINLKSQASKLSRRSPESLAVKSEAEGKPKGEPEAPKSTEP